MSKVEDSTLYFFGIALFEIPSEPTLNSEMKTLQTTDRSEEILNSIVTPTSYTDRKIATPSFSLNPKMAAHEPHPGQLMEV